MNHITRRAFVASGVIWNAVHTATQAWKDGAYPSLVTHDGLQEVAWDEIEAGDEIVVHYWEGGRIVRIASFTALSPSDTSKSGHPINVEHLTEIHCCRG